MFLREQGQNRSIMQIASITSSPGRSETGSAQPKCLSSNVHNKKKQSITEIKPEEHDDSESTPSDDAMSEESLLDSCADEESSIDSEYVGYDRIVKRFERREKMLGRIVGGKSHFYDDSIIVHEMASRIETLRSIRRSHYASSDGEVRMNDALSPSRTAFDNDHRKSLMMDINHLSWSLQKLTILFEGRHTLEGAWVLCWYCIGHFGLMCISEVLVERALRKSRLSPHIFYSLVILGALFSMRVNGYLWSWLASDSYRRVKFDMHNRRVLRFWDARLLALLRRPSLVYINRVISMSTFYFLFHGCAFFYNDVIVASMKRFFTSMIHDSTEGNSCTYEQNSPNMAILTIDPQVDISHPWISFSFLLLYMVIIVLAVGATARVGGSVFTL